VAKASDGRRVAGLVVLLVLLTAVLPPSAAYSLARWRIARATDRAAAAAAPLGARRDALRELAGEHAVVCGPGRFPRAEGVGAPWMESPVAAGPSFDDVWPQDPWGRCYLLNVRGLIEGRGGLLISAGPNGTIDTPVTALVPSGDDIATLVR
jgi:hypothetical protein